MNKLEKTISKLQGKYDTIKWNCKIEVDKYASDDLTKPPIDKIVMKENLLVNSGVNEIIKLLVGNNSAYPLNSVNSYIGVGNSADTEQLNQTTLQGSLTAYGRMVSDNYDYPYQISANSLQFRTVFTSDQANFSWNEFGVFNGNPQDPGERTNITMFNRKVQSIGTKLQGTSWVVRVTVTFN